MDLLFSMRRKPLKSEPPHFERSSDLEVVRPICTISSGNIIAFSSPTELTDQECDTWGGHVYVCDLNTPWDAHKVVSTTHAISALEWDGEGKQLLVATTDGTVTVLGQKDYLINEWGTLYTTNFPGEHIVKSTFFHNGRRFVLLDKKADAPVTERIQALRPAPTLKGFGGTACPGVCIVTSTGLVGCIAPSRTDGQTAPLAKATDCLRAHRLTVTTATTAHHNGAILIACVCVSPVGAASIRCVRATVAHRSPREPKSLAPALALTLTPLPTLVCNTVPTCISWHLNEECDSLLVYGSGLALWKLTERQYPPHKMLPKDKNMPPYSAKVWQQTNQWGSECGSAALCSVTAPADTSALTALLCADNALHAISTRTRTALYSRPVVTVGPDTAAASPPKKTKYNERNGASPANTSTVPLVCCVCVPPLGGVAIAIDTAAQLHAYTLAKHTDIPTPLAVQQTTSLLEYAIVTGTDCLDVLLTLKPNIVEAAYERLIPTATCTVSWLTCILTLWGTWAAALPALRHPDTQLPPHTHTDHTEHDKAILSLESKMEMSPESAVLTALRRPLTRALDIAATALAAASDSSATHRHHGYELWADPVGISLLRKLLVVARAAGLRDTLSATLARLHQPNKPELIEECSAVSAMWGARVWEVFPHTAISLPPAQSQRPLYLEYLIEPSRLRSAPEPPPCAATDTTPTSEMDSIRYTYLGNTASYRRCARCGSRALPHPQPQRHPAQRAHDARLLPACRCGGKWTLVKELAEQD